MGKVPSRSPRVMLFRKIGLPVLVFGVAVLLVTAYRGMKGDAALVSELDRTVAEAYRAAVDCADYPVAYAWLSGDTRKRLDPGVFARGLENRRREKGAVRSRLLRRHHVSRNLFSRSLEVRLFYELTYPDSRMFGWIVISGGPGAWVVDGTYTEGASESLDFLLW